MSTSVSGNKDAKLSSDESTALTTALKTVENNPTDKRIEEVLTYCRLTRDTWKKDNSQLTSDQAKEIVEKAIKSIKYAKWLMYGGGVLGVMALGYTGYVIYNKNKPN